MATTIETQYIAINLKKHFFTRIDYLNLSLFILVRASLHPQTASISTFSIEICGEKIHGKVLNFRGNVVRQKIFTCLVYSLVHPHTHALAHLTNIENQTICRYIS